MQAVKVTSTRLRSGEIGIKGRNLTTGQRVIVTGTTVNSTWTGTVGKVIWSGADGAALATLNQVADPNITAWTGDNDQWLAWWGALHADEQARIAGAFRRGEIAKGDTEAQCRALIVEYHTYCMGDAA